MTGTITRRGRSSWHLRFDVAPINGKRQRRHVTVRGTYKDAQRELTRLLAARDSATLPEPTRMTVGAYVMHWLDSTHEQSPKTLERYRELSGCQILPHLGQISLQRLRGEHLQRWHKELIESGLAARTVTIVSLALATGMRRGELLGLMWGDVSLDAGTLRVERSVEETKAGLRLKPPKTKRGRRNITLPPDAVAMLRAHKVRQLELRLVLGLGKIEPSTLVFSDVEGEPLKPHTVSRAWQRVVVTKGLPHVSFHALRHTHASMLIRASVDILTISRRLGHSAAAITLDTYGHLIEGADAAAAKAIEGVLK